MKRRNGFTLVELLVTITIMLILIGVAVVSLRSTQPTARDKEREDDVAAIARALEAYYNSGTNARVFPQFLPASITSPLLAASVGTTGAGQYPSTAVMDTESEIKSTLRDLDPDTLRAPDVAASSSVSLIVATTNATQSPTISQYTYQPLQSDGSLCSATTNECRKFILYYQLETKTGIQKIESSHQ